MGDVEGQSGITTPVIFLDENHCGNRHLHAVLAASHVRYEKHTDHFARGIADTTWLPLIAKQGWVLLTADARIRYNFLERQAVRDNRLRMFYFARNDFAGAEMGEILKKALPRMLTLCASQTPPFIASIHRSGEVRLSQLFE